MTTTAQQNDPIYDHVNGTKTSVTTSTSVLSTPSTCFFVWIGTDTDIVINTQGNAAVDDGTATYLPAGFSGIVPVVPSVAIFALCLTSGAAIVRCCPMMVR